MKPSTTTRKFNSSIEVIYATGANSIGMDSLANLRTETLIFKRITGTVTVTKLIYQRGKTLNDSVFHNI